MNKVKVEFKEREWKKLDDWGFSVKPFLSLVDQMAIIDIYIKDLFADDDEDSTNYITAENGLIAGILESCTNIELYRTREDGTLELVVQMDDIFSNWGMYLAVEKNIENIGEFKRRLLKTVENRREELRLKYSMGRVVDDIYSKATAFITELSTKQFTKEELDKISGTIGELNESPVLQALASKIK